MKYSYLIEIPTSFLSFQLNFFHRKFEILSIVLELHLPGTVAVLGQVQQQSLEDRVLGTKTYHLDVTNIANDSLQVIKRKSLKSSPFSTLARNKKNPTSGEEEEQLNRSPSVSSLFRLLSTINEDAELGNESPRTKIISKRDINLAEIPMRKRKVFVEDGIQWEIRWVAKSKVELKSLLKFLIEKEVSEMTPDARLQWNGKLSDISENILDLCWPFVVISANSNLAIDRLKILLEIFETADLNSYVIYEAIMAARSEKKKYPNLNEMKHFLNYSAKLLADLDIASFNQTSYVLKCLEVLEEQMELEIMNSKLLPLLKELLDNRFSDYFQNLKLEDYREVISLEITPKLKAIEEHFSSFKFANKFWKNCIAKIALDLAVPKLEKLLATDIKGEGSASLHLFMTMQKLLRYDCTWENRFFEMFSNCLSAWSIYMRDNAKEQVNRVLENEREKHQDKSWVGLDEDEDHEWKESLVHLLGIFHACKITYSNIHWPNRITKLSFGKELIFRLDEVLYFFANSCIEIIRSDNCFQKSELVFALNGVSNISAYLQDMLNDIDAQMDLEEGIRGSFSICCNSPRSSAEMLCESLMDLFIECESPMIDKYVEKDNIYQENDDCLLGHVDEMLQYLDTNLEQHSMREEINSKVGRLLNSKMISKCEKILQQKERKLIRRHRKRQETESFISSLDEYMKFKDALNFPANAELEQNHLCLKGQFETSSELISSYLDQFCKSSYDESEGKITFKAGIVVDKVDQAIIHINLLNMNEIRSRSDGKTINPSVTVRIYPNLEMSYQTPVYPDTCAVLFDLFSQDIADRSSHTFAIGVKNLEDISHLALELFDNSQWKTHKVFRGWVLIPIEKLPKVHQDLKELQEFKMHFQPYYTLDTEDNHFSQQLISRRHDSLAKHFVSRMEKYAKGSRMNQQSYKNHWVKLK